MFATLRDTKASGIGFNTVLDLVDVRGGGGGGWEAEGRGVAGGG